MELLDRIETQLVSNRLPLVVFNGNRPGNLMRVIQGEPVGTVVKE